MNEARRLTYLDAMGITVWQRRDQQLPERPSQILLSDQPQVETQVEISRSPGDDMQPDKGNSKDLWSQLEHEVLACTACPLHTTRTNAVFGDGNREADWMFVGEAPGGEEDRKGLPFVGRAGQLLNAMFLALGMQREQVYIANVLKCRPPGNRDPLGEEVMRCEPYLHRQVQLAKPRIMVALGKFAAQSLLRSDAPVSRMRGVIHHYSDTGIPLIVTYHPAYLLRNPSDKRKVWQDLLLARRQIYENEVS